MPNSLTLAALVLTATKCAGTAASPRRSTSQARAVGVGVGHRLLGGEGLGGDDEEGLVGLDLAEGLGHVRRVDVGDVEALDGALGEGLEGLVGHGGAEVGAADADVDDVADGLAGGAAPLAGADAGGEVGHAVEDGVDVGVDVLPVDDEAGGLGGAEGGVEDGAVLGLVDMLAGEHPLDLGLEVGFLGELEEELEGGFVDEVLGVVERPAGGGDGHLLGAVGVFGEELLEGEGLALDLAFQQFGGVGVHGVVLRLVREARGDELFE